MTILHRLLTALAALTFASLIHAAEPPSWASEASRCPSRFGPEDQRGTMNLLTPARMAQAAKLVKSGQSYELGRPLSSATAGGGRIFSLTTLRTTGPAGSNGRTGNEEMVTTALGQVGTDLDGFAHVGIGDSYYNCNRLKDIEGRSGFKKLGIETVGTIFTRGVLIDVAASKGVKILPPHYEITVQDLQQALAREKITLQAADAVIVNVVWENLADADRASYRAGTPGLGEAAGLWLAQHDPVLLGSDNDAVEMFSIADAENPQKISLPVHQITLTVFGIHILENLHLTELARDNVYEFLFVAQPLKMVGATGSTVAPTAIR
jgi:kynurenine formamidase